MSNLLLYYRPKGQKHDPQRFSGFVTKSEFLRRGEFIHKRIARGFSAEEVSFLIGRNKLFIEDYEEMSGGIRPDGEDIQALSELLGEDLSILFPPQGDDLLDWEVSGTKKEKDSTLFYQAALETDETGKLEIKAEETIWEEYENVPVRDHGAAFDIVTELLEGNYFLSSRSALEIFTTIQGVLAFKMRPVALKWEISHFLLSRKLCCYRNSNGKWRYHKRIN
ncbi:hypothetical protein EDD80_11818 [Anseongella ginsenosidimutans]|uniref:Uncharacterized protein n=1 Tax=Anseongella ginsenosidimutans TaxID=496056 RepID=A0A4R3KM24_9SPHI|nr:hypothetical protein [Anseongella ginsenosidimutans]QEC51962.1 hypothetical protein FRZ59_06190 [Anseongella ginsenosidimutans]TCS84749.1 hypothetical protein EDD80_11818 [Anseongella ginsenosidimutans]